MSWGAFPDEVVDQLRRREWDNAGNLRARLLGERPFPITVSLKAPSGVVALKDLGRFQAWIEAWRRWPRKEQLVQVQRSYRQVGRHLVPVGLTVSSMQELIECLGPGCIERARRWERRLSPTLDLDARLYPTLVRHLTTLEAMSEAAADRLALLLPQLHAGMGTGLYLRALPVRGVDTKFVESHAALLNDLLDCLHHGAVSAAGGLRAWLGCLDNPVGWVFVRALDGAGQRHLGGLSILRLPTQELLSTPLPAARVLIVENLQSGLALPTLEGTVAVFGGGRNLAWTVAGWLSDRRLGYWGDLDSWGLKCLSDARLQVDGVEALMMNAAALERFFDRAVHETEPYLGPLPGLTPPEVGLYERLLKGDGRSLRLEQERLDADYVNDCLQAWVRRT